MKQGLSGEVVVVVVFVVFTTLNRSFNPTTFDHHQHPQCPS